MKDVPEHELLSAYLDGELTVAERARVEQFLADSPAARQTLEELRSVSMAVQSLPELRVGEDLSGAVLRQAERAILTGPGERQPRGGAERASPTSVQRWRALLRRVVTSRGFAWAGTAVAIALLIMLSGFPERGRERDVVRAPEPRVRAPARDAVAELRASDEAAVPEPEDARLPAAAPARPARPAPAKAAPLLEAPAAVREAPPPAPAKPLAEGEVAPEMAEAPEAPEAPRQRAAPLPPGVERLETPAVAGTLRAPERRAAAVPADQPVLLVQCDITPEAARQGAFDRVLAEQQIALHDGRADSARAEPAGRPRRAPRPADEPLDRVPQELAEAEAADVALDDTFDVVYVEATPEQVTATLDQLAQLPDQFLAVSVKPAPGMASQQALTRFNRRAVEAADVEPEEQHRLRGKAMRDADPAADAKAAAEAAGEIEAGEPYRVLFVLRVVPPDVLAEPAAAALEAAPLPAEVDAEDAAAPPPSP